MAPNWQVSRSHSASRRFHRRRLSFQENMLMRVLVSGLLAAALFASPMASAQCVRADDRPAFDITALKTKLMVTALTCGENEKYNAFVFKYRPELTSQDKALNSYFNRVNARRGRQQHDDYITQLANSESQTGLRQGSLFCRYNLSTFDEVMSLRNTAELTDYAAGRSVSQPISMNECGAAPAAAARTRARRRS
jgi:hypothetical protein